jgi:hypothetical protein
VTSMLFPPYIIERSSRGERTYDIFSRLLMDRIVFLGAGINDEVSNIIIAQLLFLDADNPEKDIYMYINSSARRSTRSAWGWRPRWGRSSSPRGGRGSGARSPTPGS